jgi:hypothetical protein
LPIYIFYQNFQCKNIKETPKKYQEIKKNVLEFFVKKIDAQEVPEAESRGVHSKKIKEQRNTARNQGPGPYPNRLGSQGETAAVGLIQLDQALDLTAKMQIKRTRTEPDRFSGL